MGEGKLYEGCLDDNEHCHCRIKQKQPSAFSQGGIDEGEWWETEPPVREPVENPVRKERGADYGPVDMNHISIGAIWGGLLLQALMGERFKIGEPVPPELVTLMMVGVKLSREAFRHKDDNIVDGKNYLDFTGELSQ